MHFARRITLAAALLCAGTAAFAQDSWPDRPIRMIVTSAAGGGIDYLITPNVFVRAEYEYVNFATVAGIKGGISTARVGAALRY